MIASGDSYLRMRYAEPHNRISARKFIARNQRTPSASNATKFVTAIDVDSLNFLMSAASVSGSTSVVVI
jgi:hypothetical protein